MLLAVVSSHGQASKNQEFSRALTNIVTALASRDSATLSKYTDKNTGIYIINRIGITDSYKHYTTLGFTDTTYPNVPFYDDIKLTPLRYEKLPEYDCETWTKTGTFVDTTQTDHLLSETAKYLKKEFDEKISDKTISGFYELENKSRRVVIAENDGNELIIYMSYINKKWVLIIIDKVTADCST